MKKINYYLSFIAVFALLFTSCSKDEEPGVNPDSDKATLSFGAIVKDLVDKGTNKQSDIGDLPACTDDTAAYVEIVLMQGEAEVVGSIADPFRVDLVEGQLFTEEVPELELTPGNYSLHHFSVYNSDDDLIWLAPKGGVLAEFVDNALPLNINLGAGVKKYVDVSVICYDDRDVNQYGYMFFELDANMAFEYCFFANYCTPEGRHYPARYSVDISIEGNIIYSGEVNTTGTNNDGDFYADPLCFALPDLAEYADDEEYIDYTITLLDWDEAYGDVEQMVYSESLSRAEIMANFNGENNVEYEHIRFGCDDDTTPPVDSDNDGVVDSVDQCPDTPEGTEVNEVGCPIEDNDSDNDGIVDSEDNCPNTPNEDQADADGDGVGDVCDNCPETANPDQQDSDNDGIGNVCDNCPNVANPDQTDENENGVGDACETAIEVCEMDPVATGCDVAWLSGEEGFVQVNSDLPFNIYVDDVNIGTVTVTIDGGSLSVASSLNVGPGYLYSDYEIWVSTSTSSEDAIASACASVDPTGTLDIDLGDIDAEYGYYIRMKANVCPAN